MITIYYTKKGTPYVWASELHSELNIVIPLSTWFTAMIEYGFNESKGCGSNPTRQEANLHPHEYASKDS